MSRAGNLARIGVIVGLVAAVAVAVALRQRDMPPPEVRSAPPAAGNLPRLLDLGSVTCIPCREMAPILEELKKEYAGRLAVEFIDVQRDPHAARRHGVRLIPTQIFFDADGNELDRHEGFLSKEDILLTWRRLGIDLTSQGKASSAAPSTQPGSCPCSSF